MTSKLTKQGVRDLDHLPSKPSGVRLPEPPKAGMTCHHSLKRVGACEFTCRNCGVLLDSYGSEIE